MQAAEKLRPYFIFLAIVAVFGYSPIALTDVPSQRVGPSFDCNKVRTPSAQFICGNPDLSRTDLEFVQAYYALRQQVGPAGWQALKREDLDSQSRVEAQCGITPSGNLPPDATALATCLGQGYRAQRSLWLSRLSGAALEEASRPAEQHVALQRDLQALGFLLPTVTIDGVYGAATRSAISAMQNKNGMPVTGFVGRPEAEILTAGVSPTGAAQGASTVQPSTAPNMPEQNLSDADRVRADQRAKNLGYAAVDGDKGSLAELQKGSAAGIPSSQYGLATFYFLDRAKRYGAQSHQDLFDEYLSARDKSFANSLNQIEEIYSRYPNPSRAAEGATYKKYLYYLKNAADVGDPAAMSEFGMEYWNNVSRFITMMSISAKIAPSQPDPSQYPEALLNQPHGKVYLDAATEFCRRAKNLLLQASKKNWPGAFVNLAVTYVFTPPFMSRTGCGYANPTYADQLLIKAGELGSPSAMWSLYTKYRQESSPELANAWAERLKAVAVTGDREAAEFVGLLDR